MIERAVFYQRLGICRVCDQWRGVCLKGHPLQSPVGCPLRKFDPVGAAGYHTDTATPEAPATAAPAGRCCGGVVAGDPDVVPLSWNQALSALAASMAKFAAEGFQLAEAPLYAARLNQCRACPEYRYFQCRVCRCVCVVKARVAHETCPKQKWPVVKA